MIQGIGTDIIEIARIQESIKRHGAHFLNRIFTPEEQAYCNRFQEPATHFAGRFAAKEAIAKALGTGFGKELSFQDIEILNDASGKPIVTVSNRKATILISISHCQTHAMATAILQ